MQAEYTYFIKSSESETGFGTSPVTTNLYLQNNKNKNKDKSDVLNLTLTILEKNDSMFYLRKGSRRRTFWMKCTTHVTTHQDHLLQNTT